MQLIYSKSLVSSAGTASTSRFRRLSGLSYIPFDGMGHVINILLVYSSRDTILNFKNGGKEVGDEVF